MNSLPPLRIGQITDLHVRGAQPGTAPIASRRSREILGLLPKALEEFKRRDVDFIAVTGDLIDAPNCVTEPDFYYEHPVDLWTREAEEDYRAIKDLFDASGIPYMILPGNHDVEKALWKVFDRNANVMDLDAGYRVARFCDREGDCHLPRRLDREIRLWDSLLQDGDGGRPQIHLQHFVITPELNRGYPHTYYEHECLRKEIAESGRVALSLSGHYHLGTDLISRCDAIFSTGPAFCDFPHPIRIYDLGSGGITFEESPLMQERIGAGRRAVFIDRDGVLTVLPSYSTGPSEIEIVPGAGLAVRRLREAGLATAIVSSQACIGAGYATNHTVDACFDKMYRLMREEAGPDLAQPDTFVYSKGYGKRSIHPDLSDVSDSKPSPALLLRAAETLGLSLEGSYMIGDRESDLQAGITAGATPILVRTGYGKDAEATLKSRGDTTTPIVNDISEAVELILKDQ